METAMQSLTPESLVSLYEKSKPGGDALPLQNIGKADWNAITHAHGSAGDIPALLRALLSDNSDHRAFATLLLFETIWHQGDVYEATAYVIPFLYNLLTYDGPHDKLAIAQLIHAISLGHPPKISRCEGDTKLSHEWRDIFTRQGMDLEVEFAKERVYIAHIRSELKARRDDFEAVMREAEAIWGGVR